MSELLAKLSERFPVEDVKQRRQGGVMLDYISIDATIRRLNDVLGTDWSFRITKSDLMPNVAGGYLAVVTGKIEALGKVASGVGADSAGDPDKALKTALAEALKKAGHQFGIGLYLWEESERAEVARQRKVVTKGHKQAEAKYSGKTDGQDYADAAIFSGGGSF